MAIALDARASKRQSPVTAPAVSPVGLSLTRRRRGSIMRRVTFFIDGFNLYYGALKPNPRLRWLDLEVSCRRSTPSVSILGGAGRVWAIGAT